MRENNLLKWMALFIVIAIMNACGVDIPKETESSFETMVVDTTDIESPMKFSAKMKGRADVTISPQVSGGEAWLLSPPGSSLKRRLQGNA